MNRFFQSLDAEGWHKFAQGIVVLVASALMSYILFLYVHRIIAAIVCLVGFDIGFILFDKAMLGSIFRNKDGKNRDLYLSKKDFLDRRFKSVLSVDVIQEGEGNNLETDESPDIEESVNKL